MAEKEVLFSFCLRLADHSLVHAQRLAEWTGHGPFLEEDLALTNISLDMLGRANALLTYAGQLEGKGRDGDQLAFHRGEREFFNPLMVEQPNGDYAYTILRLGMTSAFDALVYSQLTQSKDETLRGIAEKSVKEISYHKRHSFSWIRRFAGGTEESRKRLESALQDLWRFSEDLFATNEGDKKLLASGIAPDMDQIRNAWVKDIQDLFTETGLKSPDIRFMQRGSREGKHSEHLGFLLAEMQFLPRAYPDAKW